MGNPCASWSKTSLLPPIRPGDRRRVPNGAVLTVYRVQQGRVYARTAEGHNTWVSTRAWRALEGVEPQETATGAMGDGVT